MSTLTDFLLARIAEKEAVAQAATPGPWEWEPESDHWGDCGPNLVTVAKLPPYSDGSIGPVARVVGSWGHDANGISVDDADAIHIARHDPTRVLAECKADRLIVELCTVDYEDSRTSGDDGTTLAEEVLHALALPYFDHPDYAEATR